MFDFMSSPTITYGLAFVTVTLIVYGCMEMLIGLRRHTRKRIERRLLDNYGRAAGGQDVDILKNSDDEKKWAMAHWLSVSQRGISFRKLCDQAAVPIPAHQVLAYMGMLVVAVLVMCVLLNVDMISTMVAVVLAVIAPVAVLMSRRNRRMKRFNSQLPEVFELLSQSLRAGHSLAAGIALVADQLPDPVGIEFSRVRAEQDLGIKIEEALEHLAERVDLLDLRMFVTAVNIQRQTGGNLTEIMDNIGEVIRDRIRILGQVRALTAEGRLSGLVLIALPLVILLLLFQINPEHPKMLMNTHNGQWLMATALVMQVLGIFFIRKIVNIRV
ncbi:MAG: hypothetical protein HJJLKODD_01009 [Phycisphaerae bacterium]|nr:hypothetical protein [Phycisphaerae bacterium]